MVTTEGRAATILLVEDDLGLAAMLRDRLSSRGYRVLHAQMAAEAEAIVDEGGPDLIILDLLMPAMDGVTLLEVIRSSPRWLFTPVVILTAYPEDPRLAEVAALGVDRVFAKAKYDLNDLIDYVEMRVRASTRAAG